MARFRPARLLRMPSVLLLLGLGVGLALGPPFPGTSTAAMVALAALMTFSLVEVRFAGLRGALRLVPLAVLLSFVLHPALLLLAAAATPRALWDGWVLMAAVPPAVSVVPFTAILRGDVKLSVTATALLYVLSLGLTPLLALLLLDVAVPPGDLVLAVLALILVPFLLSRGVAASPLRPGHVEILRNLTFAVLTFFIGAGNHAVVRGDPLLALAALGASAGVVVAAAGATWGLLRRVGTPQRVSLLLFSGYKNSGLAATLALALLAPPAVLAPTMMILFQILWIALLARWRGPARGAGG